MSLARHNEIKDSQALEPLPITMEWAASVLPRRRGGEHKWSVGGVVIVAGSPELAGAAVLCCAAAGRSGAGIVTVAVPRSIAPVIVGLVPETKVLILPEGEGVSAAARAAAAVGERLEQSQAMVIGPGLGDDDATANLLGALFGTPKARGGIGFGIPAEAGLKSGEQAVIAANDRSVVVDADALNWLATQEGWWERVPQDRLVLTPHLGEMARLVGLDAAEIAANAAVVAQDAASRWGQTVVLKGSPTIVAGSDGVLLSSTTPASLATAGSGDVLSGSIAAFLAQGLRDTDAAGLAVFVGSRAADRVASRYGTLGVVAGDLPTAIAEELRAVELAGA